MGGEEGNDDAREEPPDGPRPPALPKAPGGRLCRGRESDDCEVEQEGQQREEVAESALTKELMMIRTPRDRTQ